jgi:hypothetical protein
MQMDKQTGMAMVLVAFRSFNAHKTRNATIESKTLYLRSTSYCFQCSLFLKFINTPEL